MNALGTSDSWTESTTVAGEKARNSCPHSYTCSFYGRSFPRASIGGRAVPTCSSIPAVTSVFHPGSGSSQTRPADRDSPSVPLRSAKVPALKNFRRASEAESGPEGDILQCRQVRTNPRIILVFHELDCCQVGRRSHLGGLSAMTPWTRELHNVIRPWRALLSALPRRYMYVPWGSASDFL